MEDKFWNGRNDNDHERHHNLHNRYRNPWNFSIDPSSNTHLFPFEQPSSSSSSSLTFFNHLNNHHHNHHHHYHNHVDTFPQDPTFVPIEAKASQSFLLPPPFLPSADFPLGGPSDSLTLKLGKRHYLEDVSGSEGGFAKFVPLQENHLADFSVLKRGRAFFSFPNNQLPPSPSLPTLLSSPSVAAGTPVPRCQVEGCNQGLTGAKEYHRRHKVCAMHSKAPKVIVQGLEQRFCQQCSRFHVVSEFDESKRSCRRRLAGHNERRRKNASDSTRNLSQDNRVVGGSLASEYDTSSSPVAGRALSLLSSEISPSWAPPSDLSSRSSAALRELIAENRAASFAKRHFPSGHDSSLPGVPVNESASSATQSRYHQQQFMLTQALHARPTLAGLHSFHLNHEESNSRPFVTTLDLIPAPHVPSPSSAFRLVTERGERHDDEVDCEIWRFIE